MSALAIVQARMSSTRLPGKSIADVCGEPMLALLVKRLRHASLVDDVVVATSTDPADSAVADVAAAAGCLVHRGPLEDVLTRYVEAAAGRAGPIVRITGDCPLVDPELVDAVIGLFENTPICSYASNIEPRTYPDGLDVEVVDSDVLREVAAETSDPAEREHVTLAIQRAPDRFPRAALVGNEDLGELRWTVDTHDDLAFVRAVVARLGDARHSAGMARVLEAIRAEPSLARMHGVRG